VTEGRREDNERERKKKTNTRMLGDRKEEGGEGGSEKAQDGEWSEKKVKGNWGRGKQIWSEEGG